MYSYLYYVLGGMMMFIGLVASALLVRAMMYPKSYAKKLFTFVIVLAMFSRGVYFLLSPSIISGSLQSFPLNAFLFWTYFMLFVSWADFYYQASIGREFNFFKSNVAVGLLTAFIIGSIVTIAAFFFTANTDAECKRVDLGTSFFIDNPDTKSFSVAWYWVFIYFVSLEIVPTCAMLYFLRKAPSQRAEQPNYAPLLQAQ
ncbi:hypothetical protein PPL_00497 [Heterostelium album PN500]|uniref:THH1/TOM1/TOM3 domain-containing protein n=1 Tax=Heterostelium pallidum (strain ATCC 26659 / Pp 5 / PN500) TaxID=670386 RepID=D3AWM2_HETP5|nr:hypothetical protein PPL_00497 [Heterostelium album PN500]EFA86695.1 hypothetical protein PPL_00497 [Heterostelium album PN500]|eukprot:XP_020438799.1 hypothetical protein PPL_00497 [Heterostelium album PN500]